MLPSSCNIFDFCYSCFCFFYLDCTSYWSCFSSCLCAPHKTINLLLQNRCALFPLAGASCMLTPSHIHIHTIAGCICVELCACRLLSFRGFCYYCCRLLGATVTRQQAFAALILLLLHQLLLLLLLHLL